MKKMKAEVDDYLNNGFYEMVRSGNNIFQRNVLPPEKQKEFFDSLANQEPKLKKEIEILIDAIRHDVLQCNPLQLLNFTQMMFLQSVLDTSSEFQLMGVKNMAVARATEYIQSIFVSSEVGKQEELEDPSVLFLKISSEIEQLYQMIMQYYLAYGAAYKKTHEIDNKLLDELIEAQMAFSVRGERYQCFEKEYNKFLLEPHNDIFVKLFGQTSEEIIDGISKMQYALSQGRFDSSNEFMKMFDDLQNVSENHIEEYMESQKAKVQELMRNFLGTDLNDVCKITGWNETFVKELSFGINEYPDFWNETEFSGWPIVDLPVQKRPFITIENRYYCFDYYSFSDNIYRAIQKTISRLDSTYKWSDVQNKASELMVEALFQKLLPGCSIYRNNYYPKNGSLKQMCENDILVQYYDLLCVIEVKAGSFTFTPPITDFKSHIISYQKLIEEPNSQCMRTDDYLRSGQIIKFYNEDKSEKFCIDMSRIEDTFLFSVSVDNINTFASRAEKLSFISTNCNAICIAVDDLMVYRDYFDSPLKFIHFLKQRSSASLLPTLIPTDELDHLGMYIEHNCYSMYFEGMVADRINPMGYREELDTYFNQKYHLQLNPEKPIQHIPSLFDDIIAFLDCSDIRNKISVSNYLLNFSIEAKETFSEQVSQIFDYQKTSGKRRTLTTAGKSDDNLRYSCFVEQPHIPALSHRDQDDYIWSNMLWNEEKDRAKITLSFDYNGKIVGIDFSIYDERSIPVDRRGLLFEQGKRRADERLQRHLNEKGKIGRNELCPCGSGKKFKKCCGKRA